MGSYVEGKGDTSSSGPAYPEPGGGRIERKVDGRRDDDDDTTTSDGLKENSGVKARVDSESSAAPISSTKKWCDPRLLVEAFPCRIRC